MRYKALGPLQFGQIAQLDKLGPAALRDMAIVAKVLPFRVNSFVLNELIDWDRVPDDPIFQLAFPHREMLSAEDFELLSGSIERGASADEVEALVAQIRQRLNPHPAGQLGLNTPQLDGTPLRGLQHKYRETVLFFPKDGQTCHAYCAFCFRWPQFVNDPDLRIALEEGAQLTNYLRAHTEVTDLLVTGGDPLTMKTRRIARYLEPLLDPAFEHVQNIRIGTKALSFWPHRLVDDDDADDLLRLFEKLTEAGKHVAIMAHINHPAELSPPIVRQAIRRLRNSGAQIRSQAPLLRHVNDDAAVWSTMWKEQVRLGIAPYYMFVARDTGAHARFHLPLAKTFTIYQDAIRGVSGLARTARGPSMSTSAGKIEIQGVASVAGQKVFVLAFLQSRVPEWSGLSFFAKYDDSATWFEELRPAFGEAKFFFE